MYDTIKVVYNSALVKWLITELPPQKIDHRATAIANGEDPDAPEGEDEEKKEPVEGQVLKIVYEEMKLDDDQQRFMIILKKVIPQMVAYRTLINMKNIKEGRQKLFTKELEKMLD